MLLRGVSKQVVVVRDTGSDYFEEAFFIVSPRSRASEEDLATEARHIVAAVEGRRRPQPHRRLGWWPFLGGGVAALLVALGYGLAQLI